jgi:hypothetical protein
MAERESKFQQKVIRELEYMFPGCLILKNDSGYIQGIPDLLILYKTTWGALEVKKALYAARQPNQEYYIDQLDAMSFAAFICPENMQEVLNELQQTFRARRATRLS